MKGAFLSLAGVSRTGIDVLFIVMFLLFSIAEILVAVFLLSKAMFLAPVGKTAAKDEPKKINVTTVLLLLLALGLVLRLIFVFVIKGYREEFRTYTGYFEALKSGSIAAYYKNNGVVIYPVVAYIMGLFGAIANACNVSELSQVMPLFVKLPLIICDILTALLLYRAAKKYVNEYVALITAGLVCLFPPFIFASSVWGSVYSIFGLFVVLTFYFIASKNFPALIGSYSLALLTAKDAMYLFPVVAVFVVYSLVKSSIYVHKHTPQSFTSLMKDKNSAGVVLIPIYIVASFIFIYLVSLPALIDITANPFKGLNVLFFTPLGKMTSFGHNALNIFNLFGRNGTLLTSDFPSIVFVVLFALIVVALVLLVYLSRKNRANLSFLGTFIILTLSVFYMGFSELNLIAVMGLTLLSFILIKDKRILQIFALLGFAVLFNAATVMANAGYLNNLADFELDSSNSLYTGSVLLNSGGAMAINIICSCITLLTFVYATLILLDFSMSNKRKLFAELEKPSFFESIKNWII